MKRKPHGEEGGGRALHDGSILKTHLRLNVVSPFQAPVHVHHSSAAGQRPGYEMLDSHPRLDRWRGLQDHTKDLLSMPNTSTAGFLEHLTCSYSTLEYEGRNLPVATAGFLERLHMQL